MHAVSCAHDGVGLQVCHSQIHAVNFKSQIVLPRQTAAIAGQKSAERSLMGHGICMHAISHCPGCIFFRDILLRKREFWSSLIWEKKLILINMYAMWDSGAECAVMQYVEACELLAGVQETCYIMKQLGITLWQAKWIWWKVFSPKLDNLQECLKCEALKFSSQLPASFREEVVPVGMHSLQMWNCAITTGSINSKSTLGKAPRNLKTRVFLSLICTTSDEGWNAKISEGRTPRPFV